MTHAAVSGIAIAYIEPSVRVQDDFFTHLNGKWLDATEIPPDKARWDTFAQLDDDVRLQLRALIEATADIAADSTQPGRDGDARRIGDFYASCMDEARLDTLGLSPLSAELANIAALTDKAELPATMAHLGQLGVRVPCRIAIHQDARDSSRYVADIAQAGLGLPDRDYYLNADDARLADVLAKYQLYVEKMLAMAGSTSAAVDARAIVAFESALARLQWSRVENRDPVRLYNKVSLAQMATMAPGFDWLSYLERAGISARASDVIISQPSYLTGFAELADATSLATWKAYFQLHLIGAYATFLSAPFVDAHFAFFGTTLTGASAMAPRWKRAVSTIDAAMGESLGKLYVENHFPGERKARMEALVANLLAAYRQRIATLDWMSEATRREAQAKLAKLSAKIGYPATWRDYSALEVARDDLVGNVMRARVFESQRELGKLGQPIDRDEWGMRPHTINAYYNPEMNEVVFPASILQPPFFDPDADDAVNYGAIGAVIGHEISHAFDDQGAQYDGDGNLRNWWTATDHANFAAKTRLLVAQYSRYSPLPGYTVNGELTLGENIADNAGVAIAYQAYQLFLDGKQAPVIDGLSGDQRFFMGFGQVWRSKLREAQQIIQLKTDPHAPGQFRANGTMRNQPAFHDAFAVKPGDTMYLAPRNRVRLW
ncbi:MAG: M13 family metallopeptidase [Massilia sp.]|nr:M13 family metallopeptidase [Massilia sp.]